MLKTGELNRRISIERNAGTQDASGEVTPSWDRIGRERWARLTPVAGTERFIAEQFVAREQVEFLVRYTTDLSDISPLDRVVYPANDTPVSSQIYDIMAVHEVGWKESLRIIAARRAEV